MSKGTHGIDRRDFARRTALGVAGLATIGLSGSAVAATTAAAAAAAAGEGEDLFTHVGRTAGRFDTDLYRRLVGSANEFKEGDVIVGVGAPDEAARQAARRLLERTTLAAIDAHPIFPDDLYTRTLEARDPASTARTSGWTLGELKRFLLTASEDDVKDASRGLSSDVIACVVKIMSNDELAAVGRKVWNPLPGSHVGAKGFLSARIQPNSPTDDVDDIAWQVFDGFSFAVGDLVVGTNPVSSDPDSVARVESALQDVLVTFGLADVLPHCVLAHVDVQAAVESAHPGTTGIWFQSLAGSTAANRTFDLTTERMLDYAAKRTGKWGFYFETGQGADFTNGHAQGTDMVVHESRKYGFARLLKREVARAQRRAGRPEAPWVHLNDVAGFIGPEVFRTREQLVRCCLEDVVMGKLHGLTIGLDVCSTLHMSISLDDLDWCLDQVATAGPAYLMALPTKIDPMLGYLTTGFTDHVRLREKLGLKIDERMSAFFKAIGVLDPSGRPTPRFGDPAWVYREYRRRKGDTRPDAEIAAEARTKIAGLKERGVLLAVGHGERVYDLPPALDREIRAVYAECKKSIWTTVPDSFVAALPGAVPLRTQSADRTDYILHPASGEVLAPPSAETVRALGPKAADFDVQVVVSDGLNALAITDPGHLAAYLAELRASLEKKGLRLSPAILTVTSGRVRAGYRIGETLFGKLPSAAAQRTIVHLIGERPGSLHHTFSAYITSVPVRSWGGADGRQIDHEVTRVVSGIATTALRPDAAARETVKILVPGTTPDHSSRA